jgi:hypothetical protein
MTIEQIVEIPADHRVVFEFLAPKELPIGQALVELKLTPVLMKQGESPLNFNMASIKNANTPRADRLLGIAAHLGDISLGEIRKERLAKYTK